MIGNSRVDPIFGLALAASLPFVLSTSDSSSSYIDRFPGLVSAFTVPSAFPTSVYSTYYVKPGPTNEPQPVIYDPVLNITFPFSLTNPNALPAVGTDKVFYPPALANLSDTGAQAVVSAALEQVLYIIESNHSGLSNNCSKCIAALSVGQMVAKVAPEAVPDAMVQLCILTGFKSKDDCNDTYRASVLGGPGAQVLAKANIAGLDGQYICNYLSKSFCPRPPVVPTKAKFPKPKPLNPKQPVRSGKRAKVLHLSDLHLDTRYKAGSEANCTDGMCCRFAPPPENGAAPEIKRPAPLFGAYKCDSPFYLAAAALQSIGPLTGTSIDNPPEMTLYTGDLVAHSPEQQLSHAFIEATEDAVWQMFKAYIGGPIYAALGNHDTSPSNLDAPHSINNNGTLGQQFSWNYDHVSRLWEHYGYINSSTQAQAAVHYGAYSVVHKNNSSSALRIITLNTDFYYRNNIYAFLHADDPDHSGIFGFLIDELQQAEDAGQRAWIMGHALSGWDGNTALPNGSDMLYQIIERYSPHVIAGVFWGHTHEDQVLIYYTHNGTSQTASSAVAAGWAGPSVTPLTNLNSGYRLYEVDTSSWEIFEAYTFFADVGTFANLSNNSSSSSTPTSPGAQGQGPVFQLEYSTRAAYGPSIKGGWAADAPLNGTFWHLVTEAMDMEKEKEKGRKLVNLFNTYQGKSSPLAPNCTSKACAEAKICYIRSGSTALGSQCRQGFGSVQGRYTGV